MKKILALLALVLICSCSTDESDAQNGGVNIDNNYSIPKKYKITPPTWSLGTWVDSKGQKFEFTKSDVTCDSFGNLYSATGETLYYIIQEKDPEIVQKETENTYFLQYKVPSSTRTFDFTKISETEIDSKGAFKGIFTKI